MDSVPNQDHGLLPGKVRTLLDSGQITEVTMLVCGILGGKPFKEYEPDDLEILSIFSSNVLPALLNHHITWVISNPQVLPLILDVVDCAKTAGYDDSTCANQILRIHCIQAYYYANQENWDRAKVELMLAIDVKEPDRFLNIGTAPLSTVVDR